MKAITIAMSSLVLNTDIIVTIVSWLVIHPYAWQNLGWTTVESVYWQLYLMAVHTIPLLCAATNFIFLTDAPVYFSDAWILLVISIVYLPVNYYFYHNTGSVYYSFLNWSQPDQYWVTLVTSIGLTAFAILSHAILAITS